MRVGECWMQPTANAGERRGGRHLSSACPRFPILSGRYERRTAFPRVLDLAPPHIVILDRAASPTAIREHGWCGLHVWCGGAGEDEYDMHGEGASRTELCVARVMVERSQPSLWVAARRSSFPNLDRREKRRGRILRNGKKQDQRRFGWLGGLPEWKGARTGMSSDLRKKRRGRIK